MHLQNQLIDVKGPQNMLYMKFSFIVLHADFYVVTSFSDYQHQWMHYPEAEIALLTGTLGRCFAVVQSNTLFPFLSSLRKPTVKKVIVTAVTN